MKKLILFSVILLLLVQCSATTSKRSAGETIDDNVIVVKLRTKYINDKIVKSKQVKIKSWKGVVTLSGVLDSQTAINRTIELAEQQNGVKEVKAYLVLKDSGVVGDPFVDSAQVQDATVQVSDQATVKTETTVKTTPKSTSKKTQKQAVIETNLMDNSITQPVNQKEDQNVKSKKQPTIENSEDYEEVKY